MNYFRITAYYKDEDFSFIVDSNGMFEKLWQFSAYLIEKGIDIIEVSKQEKILDVNIEPAEEDTEHFILRAVKDGKPEYIEQCIDGVNYKAIKVGEKIYIPNKEEML